MFKVEVIRFNHADEFQEYKFSEHCFVYGKNTRGKTALTIVIDYILGTGTVEAIRSFIANADKLTIGEAIDTIINYTGLTVDEIVELVNKYIKLDGDKTIEQIINEFYLERLTYLKPLTNFLRIIWKSK